METPNKCGHRYSVVSQELRAVTIRELGSVVGNPLDRRHGRSCDLQAANDDDKPDKYDNPIAQVPRNPLRF
ncbi:unnamed protein product [Haemonchus placei]|uniref:DUF3892 domain-containing protein n=1 Tax=Haemonchus placei TaxID=6290 RepID=A0A0N4W4N6_HAEPC|nr:unnamed protein product [Haemonchus placei]